MLRRLPPMAVRIAISRPRVLARARSRLATLAHPISSTQPTAPRRINRAGRTLPTSRSASGTASTRHPAAREYASGYSPYQRSRMASSDRCASAIVRPGLRRATAARTRACRLLRKVGSGLVTSIGTHSSSGLAGFSIGCWKPGGMTPMIVIGSSSSRTVLPMAAESPPNHRCHSSCEMSATYPTCPPVSSSVKSRPSAGATPSTRKKLGETPAPAIRSGCPEPVRLMLIGQAPATSCSASTSRR